MALDPINTLFLISFRPDIKMEFARHRSAP
jgi:hypothetical protein